MPPWTRAYGSVRPIAGRLALGVAVLGTAVICAVLGARIAPYDPVRYNPRDVLESPGRAHLLGTDPLGRDVLSQIIGGARVSMVVGLV
jgi:peptide/nickel transport system permease protein